MSLDYKCLGCGRNFKSTLEKMIKRFRYGERVCLMCGGEVELPPEAVAAIAEIRADHDEVDEITCPCPSCLRETLKFRIDAREEPQTCRFCSHVFRPPAHAGGLTRGVATRGHRVSAEDVRERLPEDIGALVSVLAARAERGDLQQGELDWVAPRLEHVYSWAPNQATSLPLPPSDLADAIPVLLYPGKRYTLHKHGADREVVITRKTRNKSDAQDAVGLLTDIPLTLIGGGLARGVQRAFSDRNKRREDRVDMLRFLLKQSPSGARLFDVQEGETPATLGPSPYMDAELHDTLWGLGAAYKACLGAVCLFGRGVWGRSLVGVTPGAAARRLAELGLQGPHPDRACPAVILGMVESAGENPIQPLLSPLATAPAAPAKSAPAKSTPAKSTPAKSAPAKEEAVSTPPKPAGRKVQPSGRLLGKRKPS